MSDDAERNQLAMTTETGTWHVVEMTEHDPDWVWLYWDKWHRVAIPRELGDALSADHEAAAREAALREDAERYKTALEEIHDFLGPSSSGWAHKARQMARVALANHAAEK